MRGIYIGWHAKNHEVQLFLNWLKTDIVLNFASATLLLIADISWMNEGNYCTFDDIVFSILHQFCTWLLN